MVTRGDPGSGSLSGLDAIKTYRYLRVGMVGAVVLLTASILIERDKVDCWQTSISAYYYTPVRAIFVGSMMAVGFALIVYKGRTASEDIFLNLAGILAPVVAVAPTTDFGRCWSVVPNPLPIGARSELAQWVIDNINNNIYARLIAGALGVIVALIVAVLTVNDVGPFRGEPVRRSAWVTLGVTAGTLLAAWWLIRNWGDFYTRAHGFAAVGMFVFLIAAIIVNAVVPAGGARYRIAYAAVAILMIVGGIAIATTRVFQDHTVLWLEAYEITLFAAYWSIQTVEKWREGVEARPAP